MDAGRFDEKPVSIYNFAVKVRFPIRDHKVLLARRRQQFAMAFQIVDGEAVIRDLGEYRAMQAARTMALNTLAENKKYREQFAEAEAQCGVDYDNERY